jgi:Uma2 family endonuclease
MAASVDKLTLVEFECRYGDRKPYHEFWFGEAIPKSMPTWLHGLLQKLIMMALDRAGYESSPEVELRISSEFAPVPDVTAVAGAAESPSPTKPVDIVVEILSPEDSFQRLIRKCQLYAEWGIPAIIVLDPQNSEGWIWDQAGSSLQRVATLALPNGETIPLAPLFEELARRSKGK